MVRIGEYFKDCNVWAKTHNDFHQSINEWFDVSINGSQPPSIAAGSRFTIYKTASYTTPSSEVTNNNVYPANTGQSYYCGEAVFHSVAVNFTWGTSMLSTTAQSTGAYYLYCTGAEDTSSTSVGLGIYIVSTMIPSYNNLYGQWSSSGTTARCLARFISTGSTIKEVCLFKGISNERGWISDFELSKSSTAMDIIVGGLSANCNGLIYEYKQPVTVIMASTVLASRWYMIGMSETDGSIVFGSSTQWTSWNPTAPAMNMAAIYSTQYNYVRDAFGGTNHRILGIAKTSSGTSTFDFIIPVVTYPYSYIRVFGTTAISFGASSNTILNYKTVECDLNSEYSSGVATIKKTGDFNTIANLFLDVSSAVLVSKVMFFYDYINGTIDSGFRGTVPVSSTGYINSYHISQSKRLKKDDTYAFIMNQGTTGTLLSYAVSSTNYNVIEIHGLKG